MSCALSGPIPAALGQLTGLGTFGLHSNQLTGECKCLFGCESVWYIVWVGKALEVVSDVKY